MNLNDLRSFVRSIELGAFSAAAREDGVPRSTITRRIARLEDALGVELVRRSPSSFQPTMDGELLFRLSSGAIREIAAAIGALESAAERPAGTLVVSAPDFGRSETFAALMVAYRSRFPEVTLEVRVENRVVDLVLEGVDVAFRAYDRQIPGSDDLMSRVYPLPNAALFASPEYLDERGVPAVPADLSAHDFVAHLHSQEPSTVTLSSDTDSFELILEGQRLRANDMLLVRALTEQGGGIGLLPMFVAQPAVDRQALVRVLPNWRLQAGRIALVWPSSRHLAPRVRAFVDLAGEFLSAQTEP